MRILIVDDEKMIRNWILLLLKQIGDHSLTAEAIGDVDSALEYCDKNPVDLLITDITMPQRSGLELLQILRSTHPEIATAVLSAYDDYPYLRSALQLGALDYILKSEMQLSDIISLLKKARIFAHRKATRVFADNSTENDLLSCIGDEQALRSFIQDRFPSLKQDPVAAFAFQTSPVKENRSSGIMLCNDTLSSENISGAAFTFGESYCVIYSFDTKIPEHQREIQQKLHLLLQRNFTMELHLSILPLFSYQAISLGALRIEIQRQHLLQECRSYYRASETARDFFQIDRNSLIGTIRQIRFFIDLHRFNEAMDTLISFAEKCHQDHIYPSDVKSGIKHCMTIVLLNTDDTNGNFPFARQYQGVNHKIDALKTADTLEEYLHNLYRDYRNAVQSIRTASINPSLKKALDYININYMHHLTLEDVSRHIYLNKTYISQLFNKCLGISFVNYLESVRIHKAQELLQKTSESIAIIAEKTGYSSQSYFTKAFGKRVGMSPQKYRNLYLSGIAQSSLLNDPSR